jgi:hypothetical protein
MKREYRAGLVGGMPVIIPALVLDWEYRTVYLFWLWFIFAVRESKPCGIK